MPNVAKPIAPIPIATITIATSVLNPTRAVSAYCAFRAPAASLIPMTITTRPNTASSSTCTLPSSNMRVVLPGGYEQMERAGQR